MKITHVKGQTKPKEKMQTKKDREREYAKRWVLEQTAKSSKKFRVDYAAEIAAIKELDPTFII